MAVPRSSLNQALSVLSQTVSTTSNTTSTCSYEPYESHSDKVHRLELDLETLRGDVKMLMEVVWRGEQVIEELQQELATQAKVRERQQLTKLQRQILMNQAASSGSSIFDILSGGKTGGK